MSPANKWLNAAPATAVIALLLWGYLADAPKNISLTLQCRGLETGHLGIDYIGDDQFTLDTQDYPLSRACGQQDKIILLGIRSKSLEVTARLYSREGKLLASRSGSVEKGDIHLDENGFHVRLTLSNPPPKIHFDTPTNTATEH